MSFAVPPRSLTSSHPHGYGQRFCCTQFLQAFRSTSQHFPTCVWMGNTSTSSMWDTCELWGHFRGVWIPWDSPFPAQWVQHLQLWGHPQGLGEFSSEECPLSTSYSRLSFFLLHMNFQDVKESLHLHGSKWEMYVKWGTTENYIF